jgi:hypothetical protein
MRTNYWYSEGWPKKEGSYQLEGISISTAKKLLKEKGGSACTCFFDRDGSFTDTREIELKGNNTTKVHLSNSKHWNKKG